MKLDEACKQHAEVQSDVSKRTTEQHQMQRRLSQLEREVEGTQMRREEGEREFTELTHSLKGIPLTICSVFFRYYRHKLLPQQSSYCAPTRSPKGACG